MSSAKLMKVHEEIADGRILRWGDIATLEYGRALRTHGEGHGRVRVFGTNGPIGWASEALVTRSTVIVGRKGAYRGVHYSAEPCFVIDTAFYVKPKVEFDMRWAYYQLLTQNINELDSGSAIPSTTRESFYGLPVFFPSLAEQRRIARILGSLDDKIELNRRMCATLEEMARAIFRSWFVDFDPVRAKVAAIAEGRDPERAAMAVISGKKEEDLDTLPSEALASLRATAAHFPSSFADSEAGEIPEGWSPGSFGEIAVQRRRNASVADIDPEEPHVGLEHFTRASLALFDWGVGRGLESQKFRFERGEVLFGKLRPYFHKVCIAPVSGVCSTDVVVLSPVRPDWTSYMRLVVSEPAMIEHATALSDGTRMPRASWGDLSIFPVVKPPQELAARFDGVVGPMLDTLTLLPHESRTLATLRDTLLPQLMSGEISVEPVEARR